MPDRPLDEQAEARIREAKKRAFWSRVQIGRGNACWPWTGCVDWDGYGLVRWSKRHSRAHRVAWQLLCGSLPSGVCVLHRCDNPRCCNPAHLFLGTNRDNIADKVAKGRSRGAPGERNGVSRLTERSIREIRDLSRAKLPRKWIAEMYGIAVFSVYSIQRGLRWKHVK